MDNCTKKAFPFHVNKVKKSFSHLYEAYLECFTKLRPLIVLNKQNTAFPISPFSFLQEKLSRRARKRKVNENPEKGEERERERERERKEERYRVRDIEEEREV